VSARPLPWSITASNLPEHAGNPIHTDAGARAAGFDKALVAGVTSYAYCCHPVLDRFGLEWLASGEATVRFRAPVSDGDLLCFPVAVRDDGGLHVVAVRDDGAARVLVELSAWRHHRGGAEERTWPTSRVVTNRDVGQVDPGEVLQPVTLRLEGQYGADYGMQAGDEQSVCVEANVVHPAVWPALANYVFHHQLARGPWVHTGSVIRHFGLATPGLDAEVSAVVARRYYRHGERVVADVTISVAGTTVATIEHEAIVDLDASDQE
jgi:hypothetical protein